MAGHSKWANIKHRKGREDAKRGKVFTKLARAITVAARDGGADTETNVSLRLAVDKARSGNMPKDKIAKAIARGTGGDKEGAALETIVYEGYGPHSSAILVQATTDNRNRTVGDLRFLFSKFGGNIGESGSVAWQFAQRGMLTLPVAEADPDELALEAIDAGAIDVETDGDQVIVYTEAADFMRVRTALDEAGHESEDAQLAMIPSTPLELGEREAVQVLKFLDALDDLDDVDQVWSNIDISDEAVAAFEAA